MAITLEQIQDTMGGKIHVREGGADGRLVTDQGMLLNKTLGGEKAPAVVFNEERGMGLPSQPKYIQVDLKAHALSQEEGYAVLTVQAGNYEVCDHNP